MSTLKVANIHFEATGTNRVEYVANNINFRMGGGNFTISVGGTETLNVNASSVMISGANLLASVAAAATTANNAVQTTRNVSAGGIATGGGDLSSNITITVTGATEDEIKTGTDNAKAITPLRLAEGANEANGYVKMTAAGKLPAVDGSLLTNLPTNIGVKRITFTRTALSGTANVAYTGIGFTPRLIHLYGIISGTSFLAASWNGTTLTNEAFMNPNGSVIRDAGYYYYTDNGSNFISAKVVSMDVDGFTLGWYGNGGSMSYPCYVHCWQ